MRITGGRLKGRVLATPRGMKTRPTPDRVREALFSILGDVSGSVVLDLYAGTGALGIEALSRAASHVTFVESARSALEVLRENLASVALADCATVLSMRVSQAARRLTAQLDEGGPRFDLVFADPPYEALNEAEVARDISALTPLFTRDARLALEHASLQAPPVISGLHLEQTRKYGDTALSFYAPV